MSKRAGMIREKATPRTDCPAGPRLLPLKAAAEYLGLSLWGMRERVWAGDIPIIRFKGGRKIYIDRQDIDRFIEDNKLVFE